MSDSHARVKDFSDFREKHLTDELISRLTEEAKNYMPPNGDVMKQTANFSVNFSLFLLREYHDWLHNKDQ